jgi:hypothetical protein
MPGTEINSVVERARVDLARALSHYIKRLHLFTNDDALKVHRIEEYLSMVIETNKEEG